MPLQSGSRVGPYEIGEEIGAGGMGVVYRARDSRLGRDVAIKVSAERFSDRFEREARAVAALNHANICTLHDIGPDYLVMELVEGDTLADMLAKGALALDEAIRIARQIASALDAAHEKGVVHRDLKPGNIKIKTDGTVKVLDFGLAKFDALSIGADGSTPRNVTNSPTLGATGVGLIVGTAAYMAPEQARGKDVDKRADIWAFGVVLYEMVTGRRAFDGEDASTILAAVIKTEPPWDDVPLQVRRLIEKCLKKDPARRLRDIGDAWELLQDAQATSPARTSSGRPVWVAAMVFAAAAAVAIWVPWRSASPSVDRPLIRFEVELGSDVSLLPLRTPTPGSIAISPDGRRIAYVASIAGGSPKLLTRRLDEAAPKVLAGTDGADSPMFSSDGQWIVFHAGARFDRISVDGGSVVRLETSSGGYAGGSWTDDGRLLFGSNGGLRSLQANGGSATTIVEIGRGETFLAMPQLLPGGSAVLMAVYGTPPGIDHATIEVLSLKDHVRKTIARGATSPRYLSSGHIVYTNRSTMFAMPFDVAALEARGNAVPVLNDVAYDPSAGLAQYDISREGTLVYRESLPSPRTVTEIRWIDASGKEQPLRQTAAEYASIPRVSPDGKKIVMAMRESGAQDVWVYDTERDALTRLTFGEQAFVNPIWTRDGRFIVAGSIGAGLYWIRADGGSRAQPLMEAKTIAFPGSFSPDGKRLAYYEVSGAAQIWTLSIEAGDGMKAGAPERFLSSQFGDTSPVVSPDGRWLAYESNESGKQEVYVRSFGAPTAVGGKWLISNGGGSLPVWAPNGRELLYRSGDQVMSVTYSASKDSFVTERPRTWLSALGGAIGFDLAPDGRRVAAVMPIAGQGVRRQEHSLMFVQNFFDELRRRVPAK
jgi:serine/threonine protein kinase/Tol biopolymer transport system component